MTWLLILFGFAGPVIVGQFETDDACYRSARDYLVMLMQEHGDDPLYRLPAITCSAVEAYEPGFADGQRI